MEARQAENQRLTLSGALRMMTAGFACGYLIDNRLPDSVMFDAALSGFVVYAANEMMKYTKSRRPGRFFENINVYTDKAELAKEGFALWSGIYLGRVARRMT